MSGNVGWKAVLLRRSKDVTSTLEEEEEEEQVNNNDEDKAASLKQPTTKIRKGESRQLYFA